MGNPSKNTDPTPAKPFSDNVLTALANGELWRAKELLQSQVASAKFDALLYEQYGVVLLEMGDSLEAGKYLFLSGECQYPYAHPINLYLNRFGARDWQTLVASFPRHAKDARFDDFPELVREKLQSLQMPEALEGGPIILAPLPPPHHISDRMALLSCALISTAILMGISGILIALYLVIEKMVS